MLLSSAIVVGALLLTSCSQNQIVEAAISNEHPNPEVVRLFNLLGEDTPTVKEVLKWNKWIIPTDAPLSAFDSYNDWASDADEPPPNVTVNLRDRHIEVSGGGTGGGSDTWMAKLTKDNKYLLVTKSSFDGVFFNSKIQIFTEENGALLDLTAKVTAPVEVQRFFSKEVDTSTLNEHPIFQYKYVVKVQGDGYVVKLWPNQQYRLACDEGIVKHNNLTLSTKKSNELCALSQSIVNETILVNYAAKSQQFK